MNMMRNNGWRRVGVGLVALLAAGVVHAALQVQEGFDYPVIATIDGTQTGGVGFAASSSWGSSGAAIVPGLAAFGLNAAGTNAFRSTAGGRHGRSLAAATGGSTFYLAMAIKNNANPTRFGVEVPKDNGPCFGRVNGGWGFFGGVNGYLGITNTVAAYRTWVGVPSTVDNLTHLIVYKFDYAANAIKLYVDPLPATGEPALPSATLTTGGEWIIALNSATWNAIAIYVQGGAADSGLDEIRIGTTWADVAPVNPIATTTDSWWTNVTASAGASWGDANNWVNTAGANVLPGPNSAFLTIPGASYTALYDGSYTAISNLTVQNMAPYRANLVVSGPLTSLGGAAIRLRAGSIMTVTNGGVWNYEGTNRVTDANESLLSISGGGELNLSGGAIAFTNMPIASTAFWNYLNVGYESAGTMNVSGGTLEYYEVYPRARTNDNRMVRVGVGVGGDGTLNISGGKVLLGRESAYNGVLSVGYGAGSGVTLGRVVVSGGMLQFTNCANWSAVNVGGNYGYGIIIVTNSGIVNLISKPYKTPWGSDMNARFVAGIAGFGTGILRIDGGYMTVGDGVTAGSKSTFGWATGIVETTAGTLDTGSGLVLGYSVTPSLGGDVAGFANIYGGRVVQSYWGVFVGRAITGGIGFGRLTVTNGLLDIVGAVTPEATGGAAGGGVYSGLSVGVINFNDANAATRARGELVVSGSGVITNTGVILVGVNGATGTVTQSGGRIVHAPSGDAGVQARKMTVLGYGFGTGTFGGGAGSFELSGGAFQTPSRVYIGGMPTDVQSYSRSGGVGRLKVTGGSFTVNNNMLTLGGYGTGTLIIGSNGTCAVKDLILTNNTQSTLRFELGATGLGTLTAGGALHIYPGAKLEVDTTAYTGGEARFKLVDCVTRNGSFDPANITVTGKGYVRQDEADIYLQFQRGTMLMVR